MSSYRPRQQHEMSDFAQALGAKGILGVEDVYSTEQLAKINAIMDPIFAERAHESRSYVRPNDMLRSGILGDVLSSKMLDLIFSIHPQSVLYHFHAYEIKARSEKSHIFSETLGGWHRDPDCVHNGRDPTHVSIFVNLRDVGPRDGAFEFCPDSPEGRFGEDSAKVTMTGRAGTSFAWMRSFYHRASPNQGERRRRMLKISIQPNDYGSQHLGASFFRDVHEQIVPGNNQIDLLLGRYFGKKAPTIVTERTFVPFHIRPNGRIRLSEKEINRVMQEEERAKEHVVAYD